MSRPPERMPRRMRRRRARWATLVPLLKELLDETLHIHNMVSDAFLSHQAQISQTVQPLLNI